MGLAVTYGLNLDMLQAMVILSLCQMENNIISVERILQYTCIPSEPPLLIEENWLDHSWPPNGEVDIRDLQVFLVQGYFLPNNCNLIYKVIYDYGFYAIYIN